MSNYNVEILNTGKTVLGEGPHWDASRQTLYYVEVFDSSINSYIPASGTSSKVIVDAECLGEYGVSFAIPIAESLNEFVIAQGRSLKYLEWDSVSEKPWSLTTIYDSVEQNNLDGRFNDGKCDNSGRLWTGTMPTLKLNQSAEDFTKGNIYKLDSDGAVTKEFPGVGISNGVTWSPNYETFYFIDTLTRKVDAFDYDSVAGKISNRRTAFDFEKESVNGHPDGMTTDINGNLWVACVCGGQVIQIDPNLGKLIRRIELPTPNVTSLTFGGKNLDELYVTSSTKFLSPEQVAANPASGSVFKVTNLGTRGLSAGISYSKKN